MTSGHWVLYKFNLPLELPIRIARVTIQQREGFLLQTTSRDGQSGFGEISPLPGWQSCDLNKIPVLVKKNPTGFINSEEITDQNLSIEERLLHFAVHCARLTSQAFSDGANMTIPVNALLTGNDAVTACRIKREQRVTHFKLKIGADNADQDIRTINEVCASLDDSCRLRLDGNRQMTPEAVYHIWDRIPQHFIDYFEEPLDDAQQLMTLIGGNKVPVALDESVHDVRVDSVEKWAGAKAVVLKPQVIASLQRLHELTRSAQCHGMRIVFSDSYSSGIGVLINALLNRYFDDPPGPAGLDTYSYLADDILEERWKISDGSINFGNRWPELDRSKLTVVAEGDY